MKKLSFFTLVRIEGRDAARLEHGYTDGCFHYYRSSFTGKWFAIEPVVGLAVAEGKTRKDAEHQAYENAEKIGRFMTDPKRREQAQVRFDKALAAIGARRDAEWRFCK